MTPPPDKRKALGRGLGALLPGATPPPAAGSVKRDYFVVGIEEVHPSRANPRQSFDEVAIEELAESIRAQGIIQPLIVRTRPAADGGGFTLIAGERRWRAAQKAGIKDVPVVVKEATPTAAFELALVENLQRRDLNPLEEAEGYRRLTDEHGHTIEQVAQRVGKDRSTVNNALRLLRLPAQVKNRVVSGDLSSGHARTLLGLDDPHAMTAAAEKIAREQLSVRQTEALVARLRKSAQRPPAADPPTVAASANIRDLEHRLQKALGVRCHIRDAGGNQGRLEITYSSLDDLDRVLDLLLRP